MWKSPLLRQQDEFVSIPGTSQPGWREDFHFIPPPDVNMENILLVVHSTDKSMQEWLNKQKHASSPNTVVSKKSKYVPYLVEFKQIELPPMEENWDLEIANNPCEPWSYVLINKLRVPYVNQLVSMVGENIQQLNENVQEEHDERIWEHQCNE